MSILLSLQAVGAQTAEQMPDLTAVTAPTEAEINVIDLAFKGGWIMVVLLLLSLMACYIFIQRLMVIRRAGRKGYWCSGIGSGLNRPFLHGYSP